MNDILQQHDEAMALAEEGDALKEAGDITNAQFLYREAMLTELAALEICKERNHGMKSLSVLYRNAALLALKCGDAAKHDLWFVQRSSLIHLAALRQSCVLC